MRNTPILILLFVFFLLGACKERKTEEVYYRLWYDEPAEAWTEALPIGNGRIGAMVFGGVETDRIQFNEETLWTGAPRDYNREGAADYLEEIRALLFAGKQDEAEALAGEHFMGKMSNEDEYPQQLATWLTKVKGDESLIYASPDFDDSDWGVMTFPNIQGWESIGFEGLDGTVWLRFTFDLPEDWKDKDLVLNLGRIRDTDITYFNGNFINSEDNKNAHRRYKVSAADTGLGKNVVAIQVLNFYDKGGLVGFKTGEPMVIYPVGEEMENGIPLDVEWKYFIQNSQVPQYPKYQESYQPFGDLWLEFEGQEHIENYTRELDIENAMARTSYESEGVRYTREYFVSAPDQALVLHLASSVPGKLNFKASLTSLHRDFEIRKVDDRVIMLLAKVEDGALHGVSYLRCESPEGYISVIGDILTVANTNEATLYLTAATNYRNYNDVSGKPEVKAMDALNQIEVGAYDKVKATHIEDYQKHYNTFDIDLGENRLDSLTTDQRIVTFNETQDPSLVGLYVQYGRYLLISSSRQGTRPANLQGIWNEELTPPWDSKYTCNINLEMNYWPAEPLNLSVMHEPLFELIEEVAERGAKTAKIHYGANGWVLHHNTDLWRGTAPINNPNHGIWVTGGAWLCHHLWEHYEFTLDTTFLREKAYPLMAGAAEFFIDFLVEDPTTGYLVSGPSNSPENGGLVMAPAMDHQIVRELFRNCLDAAQILGITDDLTRQIEETLPKVAPDQIGQYGQLQEWLADKDDPENHHRHVSHLWAVYPGEEINVKTPELMDAAIKSLEFRGDEGTGWSLAWKLNLWSRFREGNHAWKMVNTLLSPAWVERSGRGGSYANLFDAHPPFQIDGNFGASAGILEMIVQSQNDKIVLLPALPDALGNGKIKGVKARGGYELNIEWLNHELEKLSIYSVSNGKCMIEYEGISREIPMRAGESYLLDPQLNWVINK